MDRFVAHFTNRLDAKGRVSIPSPFRQVLARDGFEGLYVHPSLDVAALDAGGTALIATIDQILGQFSPFSAEWDVLSTALNGTSEILKLDGEGRIQLPERLKQAAGIADQVAFVGLGHKFQIWEPSRFSAHLDASQAQLREVRARLSQRPGPQP